MAGGRPPKPTRLKIAAGNPGKRPLNEAEPQPAIQVPPCPAWLPARAKAEWKRITPELLRLGLVSLIDQAALATYCVAVNEVEEATKTLEADGRVCKWPILSNAGEVIGERLRPHPCVAMQRSAAALAKAFLTEFGLTPASRSRVSGATGGGPAAGGDDRIKRYFNTVG